MSARSGWTRETPLAGLRAWLRAGAGEVVEACVTEDFRRVSDHEFSRVFFNRVRGIRGIELEFDGKVSRYAPTRMIAANLSFDRALQRFLDRHQVSRCALARGGQVRAFSALQFLLTDTEIEPIRLVRGSTQVPPDASGGENRPVDLADGIGQWMLANLSSGGALPYKYWPSRGSESPADNAIRRFLGSLAFARLGELRDDNDIRRAARRNLGFNLTRYFHDIGDGQGAIVEPTGAKLGASALAALAILESPAREEFNTQLEMLAAGIRRLADDQGRFRTFFFPAERDGQNWNFYSGEALLFWAEALRRSESFAPSIEQYMAAFRQCRRRHRRARNPAFVPWHTQACAAMYAATRDRVFTEFVFEMNDWLLPMQQNEGLAPDLQGRFYNPKRPDFGPPHAASTGVYLEGLADALALARATGDRNRAEAYGLAIDRGMRNLRQLQFRDHRDAFYVSRKQRVMGALRIETYDNAVRIDSAAHALAAAIKVLNPATLL